MRRRRRRLRLGTVVLQYARLAAARGTVAVCGASPVWGYAVYTTLLLCRGCINRWGFITGWNYTRVADDVALRSRTTIISDPTIPVGTVITTLDQFRTTNNFNGGILG